VIQGVFVGNAGMGLGNGSGDELELRGHAVRACGHDQRIVVQRTQTRLWIGRASTNQ